MVRKVVLAACELDQGLDHWGVCASHLKVAEFLLDGLEGPACGFKENCTFLWLVVKLFDKSCTLFTGLDCVAVFKVTFSKSSGILCTLINGFGGVCLVGFDVGLSLGDGCDELFKVWV